MVMPDFKTVNTYQTPMFEFAQAYSIDDLRQLTRASVQAFVQLLDDATDETVCFVPDDPDANDAAAANPADARLAWNIAHNVVHATASADEYATVAAELARGIESHGRPRSEIPWQRVTTLEQCRQRLQESLRLRLASLDMWPDAPNLKVGYTPWRESGWVNAKGIFMWGLAHDDSHINQIAKILKQTTSLSSNDKQ